MFGRQKTRVGVVVGDKMSKTVIVAIETFRRHPIYKKNLRRTKRYKVHDEHNTSGLGDLVRIVETRPLSREKRWRVAEVLVKGEVAEVAPKEIDAELIGQVRKEREVEEVAPAAAVAEPEAEVPEEALVGAEAEVPEEAPEEAPAEVQAEPPEETAVEAEAAAEAGVEGEGEPAAEAEEKPKGRSRRKKAEETDEE
jgi:small subunit ribosomal protein S17